MIVFHVIANCGIAEIKDHFFSIAYKVLYYKLWRPVPNSGTRASSSLCFKILRMVFNKYDTYFVYLDKNIIRKLQNDTNHNLLTNLKQI